MAAFCIKSRLLTTTRRQSEINYLRSPKKIISRGVHERFD